MTAARPAEAVSFHLLVSDHTGFYHMIEIDTVLCLSCNKSGCVVQPSFPFGKARIISSIDQDAKRERELGSSFLPKFDSAGLLSAVVQDASSGEILMVAFMDAEALAATRSTGEAHFHSRSRGKLWKKGETSGNILKVDQLLVDCDQDAIVLKVHPVGPACHTGARSCFYRRIEGDRLTADETN